MTTPPDYAVIHVWEADGARGEPGFAGYVLGRKGVRGWAPALKACVADVVLTAASFGLSGDRKAYLVCYVDRPEDAPY